MVREMIGGCNVCLDERGWDENPLVYCDGHGCNVAVHQACYGIVKVPSGPWFCCKCQSTERIARVGKKASKYKAEDIVVAEQECHSSWCRSGQNGLLTDSSNTNEAMKYVPIPVLTHLKCELCPSKEGALKRTDNGGWAHVVCALYIPEVRFGNVSTMEPIIMSSVPHERFLKTCYICEEREKESKTAGGGACMSCNKPGCRLSFHVTCAQVKRLLCEEGGHNGNVKYVGYCAYHWAKKFTQKPLTEVEAKKQREKEKEKKPRARSDSISSSEGTNTKQRGRKPASVNMKVDPTSSSQLVNGVHSTQNSAVDSLSLLQQTSNIMGTFVKSENISNGVTSVSHNNDDLSSSLYGVSQVQFSVNDLLGDKPKSSARTSTHLEKYSVREKTTPLNRPLPGQNSSQQKPTSSQKPTQEKEKVISQPKPPSRDSRKRKSDRKILDKKAKKQKLLKKQSEKKKLQKKKKLKLNNSTDKTDKTDKTAHDRSVEKAIPKPSKLGLLENGEIRPFSPLGHENNCPRTFQELLEFQWNHGAQFLIQKAAHFDVASLLTCLHQLRDENDKLENRYKELSARRDRLLAANSRLSKPFTSPETLETQTPLSSMLAKLKSEPDSPEKTKIQSKGGPAENNEGKEKTDCPNASTGETPSSGKETKKNEMKSPSPPISGSLPPQCVSIENEVHLKTPDKVPSTSRTSSAKVEKIERKESPSKSKASPSEKDTKTKSPRKYNKHKQEKIDAERAKQYMHQQQLIMSQHSQLQQHIQNSLMQPMLSHSQDPTVMLPSAQFLGGASTFIHQMLQQQQHNHVTQMTPQQNTAAMLNLLASQPQHFASASSENSGAANFYGYGANHVTVPDAKSYNGLKKSS